MSTWNIMLGIWPLEDRPEDMTKPDIVNALSFDQMITYKTHYEALIKREGKGENVFGKDNPLPLKKFPEGSDDCAGTLHPVRFERGPVVECDKFWDQMPVKRALTYRRLALEHCGAESKISECVVVRAHDRTLPLKLKMFFSGNRAQKNLGGDEKKEAAQDWDSPKALLEVQEALLNFQDVYAKLWQLDDTPRILQRVLLHYNYGGACKLSEQDRCRMVIEFCDTVLRENANRAVVKKTPLSFRQVKERWADTTERYPARDSSPAVGKQGGQGGGARGGHNNNKKQRGGFSGGLGNFGRGGGNSGGGGSSGGAARGGAYFNAKLARLNVGNMSYPVCFDFNKQGGCNKPPKGCGCEDGRGGYYAHVCNHQDSTTKNFCLAQHSRYGNH